MQVFKYVLFLSMFILLNSLLKIEPLKKLMLLFLSILKVGITGEDCTLLLII